MPDEVEVGAEDPVIVATLDAIWAACPDVSPGDVTTSDWTLRRLDTGPCAAQPESDRWFAFRISRLPGERVGQRPLFDAIHAWLGSGGYAARRYRARLSGRLELRAHTEAVTVIAAVSTNGATSVQVFAGPCARFVGHEKPPGLEPLTP